MLYCANFSLLKFEAEYFYCPLLKVYSFYILIQYTKGKEMVLKRGIEKNSCQLRICLVASCILNISLSPAFFASQIQQLLLPSLLLTSIISVAPYNSPIRPFESLAQKLSLMQAEGFQPTSGAIPNDFMLVMFHHN